MKNYTIDGTEPCTAIDYAANRLAWLMACVEKASLENDIYCELNVTAKYIAERVAALDDVDKNNAMEIIAGGMEVLLAIPPDAEINLPMTTVAANEAVLKPIIDLAIISLKN